jgi:predicted amidohydrolase
MTRERIWAVAQMTGGRDVEENRERAVALVRRAAALGAQLVALPENTSFMGRERDKAAHAEPLDGPTVARLSVPARELGIHVLVGSLVERSDDAARPYNTSVLIGPEGTIAASYRKMHLFDVDVAGDRTYRESDFVSAGPPEPVTAEVDGVTVGLSVCFDLRFGWLYRALADAGAEVLFIPAAFTVPTGRDHWETLLRARAIETQSFVLAPAQFGTHESGRKTYGRSMIVDPWGTVIGCVPDGGEVAVARLDLDRVSELRRTMPMRSRQGL